MVAELRLFLEQLSHLEGDAHRALDLQLAGYVGHGRVELPGDEAVEVLEADGDGGLGVARVVVDQRRRLRSVPEDHAVAAEIELDGVAERRGGAGLGTDGGSGAVEGHGLCLARGDDPPIIASAAPVRQTRGRFFRRAYAG